MEHSAGIIFYNKKTQKVLLAHATETSYWGIPKGHIDPGEDAITAAIRETKEEIGFDVHSYDLIDFGVKYYIPKKDLHIFVYNGTELPIASECVCTAWFYKGSRKVFEMDRFEWVSVSDIPKYCNPSMSNLIASFI